MARVVVKTEKNPLEVKPEGKSAWICRCGLSQNQPYCDGSHQRVADEPEDELFAYEDGKRERVAVVKK